ncbi:MAG TPA: MerR family transcriptional regulator [Oceanobacillus sp.]|nr:MerR family transcriptional regulator [Oceanobacillus sp.]
MQELSIGAVARQAGVPTSTIRYYERIGLLPRSKRVNKHRRFDSSVFGWLALIDIAQKAGFTLAEIQVLFQGFDPQVTPAERWQTMARQKLIEIDTLIARAEGMKQMLENGLRCGCLRIEDCVAISAAPYNSRMDEAKSRSENE